MKETTTKKSLNIASIYKMYVTKARENALFNICHLTAFCVYKLLSKF